jgi:hypothetical protein
MSATTNALRVYKNLLLLVKRIPDEKKRLSALDQVCLGIISAGHQCTDISIVNGSCVLASARIILQQATRGENGGLSLLAMLLRKCT